MTINENMYREIVETVQEGIWIMDRNFIVLYVNHKAAEMLGYIKEDLIGQLYTSFLTEEDTILTVISTLNKCKISRQVETMFKCKDGTKLWAAVTYNHKFNELGEYIGSQAFVTDITDRKQSEELLRYSEELYRNVFENATNCIFLVDVDEEYGFKYNIFNSAEEKATGLSNKQISGKFIEEIFNEELAEELNRNNRNCCEQGVIISYEEKLLLPAGTAYFNTSLIPIKNSDGKVTQILGIASDITELKLKEIALQKRMKLEMAIAAVSKIFISQDKANINEVLKIIGETVLVNRAYVFKLKENGEKMDNLYEWCSSNTEAQINLLQDLESEIFPWWIEQLQDGNNIVFSDIENLPSGANEEKNILREQDIKSIFVAPILSTNGNLMGFVGFDDTDKHREWADEESKVLRVIAEMIGIHWHRISSENQLRDSLENTLSMINNHEAVMLLIEPLSGKIIEANCSATSFYGYTREELLGMKIQDINALDDNELAGLQIKILEKGQKYFTFPHRLKNGEIRIVDVYSSLIDYAGEKVLFSIIFDVTKRERVAKENEYLAYHDYLTGIYNRRYFEEMFYRLHNNENQTLAIIIGDINGLKLVNDSFGFLVGDELIKETVREIRLLIHRDDILVRISGGQFAILIKDAKLEYVSRLTNILEDKLEKFVVLSNNDNFEVYLSASFGYGIQKGDKESLSDLYEDAEAILYNRKYFNTNSSRSNMINGMMSTLFQKSEREQQHSERVSEYCESIALSLGWDSYKVNKIRVAGKLHDIGKIGISEEILNKEGKLNELEWNIMKQHTIKGASILEGTNEYKDMGIVISAHHERWDGTGYPKGLQGEEIPIMARIIAVADAYDAMTSQRTYKNALSQEEAVAELIKCSGSQFDSSIVFVFVNKVIAEVKISMS